MTRYAYTVTIDDEPVAKFRLGQDAQVFADAIFGIITENGRADLLVKVETSKQVHYKLGGHAKESARLTA